MGKLEEKAQFGRLRRKEGIILKLIFMKRDGGMDWIDLAQIMDRWQAVVIAVMNFLVP